MGRKCFLFILAACVLTAMCVFPATAGCDGESAGVSVLVDGRELSQTGFVRGGEVMVPLRAVSDALGATRVTWDGTDNSASVTAEGLRLYVPLCGCWLEANGRYLYVPGGFRVRSGVSYVPAGALAWAFGAGLTYGPDKTGVSFTAAGTPPEDGESFYDGEDLYWMARIIEAEAGAEPFVGMIAVGNVVLNRVGCPEFPDSVKAVIFDCRFGIQFTPAYTGAIYNEPSRESVIAAKLALEGADVVGESLYFAADYVADTCWAGENRPVITQIGGHVFFG